MPELYRNRHSKTGIVEVDDEPGLGDLSNLSTPANFRHAPARDAFSELFFPLFFHRRMARTGIEPATQGFSVLCSTN